MPFCIGAHTAIRCPLQAGERFEDYELLLEVSEQADSHLLNPQGIIRHDGRKPMLDGSRMPLRYQTFGELDTVIFSMLRSGGVSLLHRETGRGVQLDFHQFGPHLRLPHRVGRWPFDEQKTRTGRQRTVRAGFV